MVLTVGGSRSFQYNHFYHSETPNVWGEQTASGPIRKLDSTIPHTVMMQWWCSDKFCTHTCSSMYRTIRVCGEQPPTVFILHMFCRTIRARSQIVTACFFYILSRNQGYCGILSHQLENVKTIWGWLVSFLNVSRSMNKIICDALMYMNSHETHQGFSWILCKRGFIGLNLDSGSSCMDFNHLVVYSAAEIHDQNVSFFIVFVVRNGSIMCWS